MRPAEGHPTGGGLAQGPLNPLPTAPGPKVSALTLLVLVIVIISIVHKLLAAKLWGRVCSQHGQEKLQLKHSCVAQVRTAAARCNGERPKGFEGGEHSGGGSGQANLPPCACQP